MHLIGRLIDHAVADWRGNGVNCHDLIIYA